jgi:hypothetical protein
MTTHRAKIQRFRCGYFRPCVPLFGPGGPGFTISDVNSHYTAMGNVGMKMLTAIADSHHV